MHIIILGAPGSGKGTQSNFISNKLNLPIISTSKLLKIEVYKNSKNSKTISHSIKNGLLVSNQIVIKLIKKRLKEKDCKNGFILDGFPRTVEQADSIESASISIDIVILLQIQKKNLIKRLLGRKIHLKSGRIYHDIFSPPLQKNKDDITGEPLNKRIDDTLDVIEKRIQEYEKTTVPLIKYYEKKKKIYKINGELPIHNINKKIFNLFE
ncbi:nucleoside monophosphate kinase [Buchnera aphidicola (Thelaxes californica)]|uniref:Adenylate kinase n=1 Tax=Buchnera aphidicola (Thelaxes californica) TaxID=1315998 RepID=A0A4D6YLP6_9GAMM|nr:nucleoside monophosphate kinase [Buchnera aphidicola]QCI26894.1 nucleoside monophosphate kinase [Buchnera aphidicola (Thelaxes californica)]